MTDKVVVLSTCANAEDAEELAKKLVEENLAACVTLIPGARSIYRWSGKTEESAECLLLIKSSRALFDRLRNALEQVHTYEVPELLAMPVVEGAPNYLAWLDQSLGQRS